MRAALDQNCQPVNGLVPNTRYWRYIRYRRSLAPSRFDFYHPALGAIIAEDQRLRNGVICPPVVTMPIDVAVTPSQAPQGLIPPPPGTPSPGGPTGGGGGGPGGNGGGGGGPGVVPEPASLALLVMGSAFYAIPRSWKRRARAKASS